MRVRSILSVAVVLAAVAAGPAQAACKEKRSRDPSFVELTVPEGAIRPSGVQDFAFVTGAISYDQLVDRVGPPDASQGSRVSQYIWCLADGSEVNVYTRDRVVIEQIRHNGKQIYKRAKK